MDPKKHLEITIPVPWSSEPVRVTMFSIGAVLVTGSVVLIGWLIVQMA